MTDSLESVRPVPSVPPTGSGSADAPVEPNVRELLVELAHLEDVVRAAGASVDDPEVLAALAREQDIVDRLRHRAGA